MSLGTGRRSSGPALAYLPSERLVAGRYFAVTDLVGGGRRCHPGILWLHDAGPAAAGPGRAIRHHGRDEYAQGFVVVALLSSWTAPDDILWIHRFRHRCRSSPLASRRITNPRTESDRVVHSP